MRFYFPTAFPTFWQQFETLIDNGQVISVREVLNECELQDLGDYLPDWIKRYKRIFQIPTDDELQVVRDIFAVRHFQQLLNAKNMKLGRPVADPFIVASGKTKDACVVTQERPSKNSAKLPQVCEHFEVKWTNLEGFLATEGWVFR